LRHDRLLIEKTACDPGLIRDDDGRVAVLGQEFQAVDDGRQDLDAGRIAKKPFIFDDRSVAIEKHRRPHHGSKISACSTRSQMM
jgi:hypothetical protein